MVLKSVDKIIGRYRETERSPAEIYGDAIIWK